MDMRNRLEEMSELVKTNLEKAQQKQKAVYDQGAKPRSLEVGDEVFGVAAYATEPTKTRVGWSLPGYTKSDLSGL